MIPIDGSPKTGIDCKPKSVCWDLRDNGTPNKSYLALLQEYKDRGEQYPYLIPEPVKDKLIETLMVQAKEYEKLLTPQQIEKATGNHPHVDNDLKALVIREMRDDIMYEGLNDDVNRIERIVLDRLEKKYKGC